MIIAEKSITIQNQNFILTNQRGLFWKEESALVISDLHLGKSAHFRKNGIALPSNIMEEDLKRLGLLIRHFNAKKLFIVGDFIHAGKNSEMLLFLEFKNHFPDLEISLIKGNHDRVSEEYLESLGISEIVDIWEKSGILLSHDYVKTTHFFQINGHIHPGIRLRTPTKFVKFPCYIVNENQLILPAFSLLTGLDTKNHPKNSHYYISTESEIFVI